MKSVIFGLIACFSLILISQVYLEYYSASLIREGMEGDGSSELLKDYRAQLDELRKKQDVTDADLRALIKKQEDGQKELDSAVNIEGDPDEINNLE
jgi:hypothetical protein